MSVSDPEDATVWRVGRTQRAISYALLILLFLAAAKVAVTYGYLATIGILLLLAAAGQVYWAVLRPRLSAGPGGVEVLLGRQPVHLDWQEIRGCDVGPKGLTILCAGGREVISRYPRPATSKAGKGEPTEAERVATYLAQRAAWARKSGNKPPPRYQQPTTAT